MNHLPPHFGEQIPNKYFKPPGGDTISGSFWELTSPLTDLRLGKLLVHEKNRPPIFFCVKAIKNMFKNQEQVNDLKNPSIFDFLFLNDYIYIQYMYMNIIHT